MNDVVKNEVVKSGQAFPRGRRLTDAGQFKAVFRKSYRSIGKALTVLAGPNELGFPRLGTAIAKKKTRTSVQRTRIKRLIKESFRLNQHLLPGVDLVVLARDGVTSFDNAALLIELDKHWQRLEGHYLAGTAGSP